MAAAYWLDFARQTWLGSPAFCSKRPLPGSVQTMSAIPPIRWPEPFGLVMIEALACGTPVVALRAGSVPEVIRHGETGFICDTEDALVTAVRRLSEIDRATCRQEAERRFSPGVMADGYEHVYERLVGAQPVVFDLGRTAEPVLGQPSTPAEHDRE